MSGDAGQECGAGLGEFEIIKEYFAPLATTPAALSLLDDAALLAVPEGHEIVVTTDVVIEDVHFLGSDPPDSIAHKALAVSLSDLAAKGARPLAYVLTLALPAPPERAWLAAFADGLRRLQEETGIALVGGDTSSTKGSLTISVTALGLVPQGEAVLRRGAVAGDRLCVSGTIGDAALGLKLLREPLLAQAWGLSEAEVHFLIERYRRPQARVALAPPLRHCARAALDVSDGLAADAGKLCKVSGVSAIIEAARVPLSGAAAKGGCCRAGAAIRSCSRPATTTRSSPRWRPRIRNSSRLRRKSHGIVRHRDRRGSSPVVERSRSSTGRGARSSSAAAASSISSDPRRGQPYFSRAKTSNLNGLALCCLCCATLAFSAEPRRGAMELAAAIGAANGFVYFLQV